MALLLVTMFALLLTLVASDWALASFHDADGAVIVAVTAAVAGRLLPMLLGLIMIIISLRFPQKMAPNDDNFSRKNDAIIAIIAIIVIS
jgi:hypothetical protein